MQIQENIRQGLVSLRSNGVRALITCLIIAIGIASLVGILTSIDAMNAAITKTFTRMGSQSFNIRNSGNIQRHGGAAPSQESEVISYFQANGFKKNYPYKADISVSRNAKMTARVSFMGVSTNPNVRVIGIDENYLKTASYDIGAGRNFTSNDVSLALPLAIVGKEIVNTLFNGESANGAEILVEGKRYKIVGELAEKGSSLGMSGGDRVVFIPVSRSRQDFTDSRENYFVNVAVDELGELEKAMDEAMLTMRRLRNLKPEEPSDFVISKSDALAKDAIDNLKMISAIGTVIAIITLIGATISLMNIMLVSVTERTREIGVRKALGASSAAIRSQFLTETIVICQVGGIGGIVLGILMGNLVGLGLGTGFIVPWQWMLTAFAVCMLVGLLAGVIPARKAANLDPIEALRFE